MAMAMFGRTVGAGFGLLAALVLGGCGSTFVPSGGDGGTIDPSDAAMGSDGRSSNADASVDGSVAEGGGTGGTCGQATCAAGEYCVQPSSGCGGALLCDAKMDGGACPPGMLEDRTCPPQAPCTRTCGPPPSRYCSATIPGGCRVLDGFNVTCPEPP